MALNRASDALVVVDIQNDFCPGGALGVPGGDEVIDPINRLMDCFHHIVLTQDWHPAGHRSFASSHPGRRPHQMIELPGGSQILWPDHCVQGSHGAEFHPLLRTNAAQAIVRKGTDPAVDSYSAFVENDRVTATGLAGWLHERGVLRVFIAGLAFDFCVLWSGEDARRNGFEVVVVEDACRAIDLDGSAAEARRRLLRAGAELTHGRKMALP